MRLFDIYDRTGAKTGKTTSQRKLPPGEYYLIIHVWIEATDGRFLIGRRAAHKTFGGYWECPGGGAELGETSLDTALREIHEETGIALDPAKGKHIRTCVFDAICAVCDVWRFTYPVDPGTLTLQKEEVTEAMLAAPEEILRMAEAGEFIPVYGYLEWLFGSGGLNG